ncbi:MAG: methylmalonyl-CoA mutase small subunit [Bacteroidales bacterium]|nr:methylmalonyl-CoA mutase small subunit [Bacteroidales bacterium]
MAELKEKLFSEFPPVSPEAWKEKIIVDLKGADFDKKLIWKTNEGFNVNPFYTAEDIEGMKSTDSLPGEFPFIRGTKTDNSWYVRQDIHVADFKEANKKAFELLEKGVTSLGFHIKKDALNAENLATLLDGICPEKVELNFKTCNCATEQLLELLTSFYTAKGYDLSKCIGSVAYDPFKKPLIKGVEADDWVNSAIKIFEASKALPKYRVLTVNAINLNNAGSYIYQELGYALAWGNEILAKLTDAGLDATEVAKKIKFNFGISTNYFMEIAKFRAARMLWANIVKAYQKEGDCECAAKIYVHAQTSEWNMTVYDAHVNLLRSQTEAMSAALAGVNSLLVVPFDKPFKVADDFSERIARNQQLLLKEECHFDKVVDPSAGSYYIENLTQSIAKEAWKLFLSVEDEGGFYAAIKKNSVQEAIKASSKARKAAIATRRESLLGTNQYPNFTETAVQKIKETPSCNCGCNSAKSIEPLCFERGAVEFEELRLATERSGKTPKAFMLTIGNLAMRLARSQFSCNFFACAGYKVIDNLGFDTVEAGIKAAMDAKAEIVVLCSSDDEYATFAPEAKAALKDKAILVVAGAPACMEELKAQGIDQFIHVRSNVLETLKDFNKKLGIC